MIRIDNQVSRSKVKVKPILDMLGKEGISVSQTAIYFFLFYVLFHENIKFLLKWFFFPFS